MNVCVIGVGMWGKNIANTLKSLDCLGCIVEADQGKHQAHRDTYGVPVFESLECADTTLFDGVAIATPAEHHAPLAIAAMRLGKHAFVEKPIALSSAEVDQMVKVAHETGRTLMAGHLLIYQPAVDFLKRAIDEGLIGELWSVHIRRLNHGRARNVENVLWSLGVHDVAVVVNLVGGEPKKVTAVGDDFLTAGIHDDTHVHLEFPGGVRAHIQSSWLWPDRDRRTIVIGSKAMLVYDELAQTVTLHKKSIGSDMANIDEGTEVVFEGAAAPLTLEMQEFLLCSQTGRAPKTDGASALTVTRILEQATEALG